LQTRPPDAIEARHEEVGARSLFVLWELDASEDPGRRDADWQVPLKLFRQMGLAREIQGTSSRPSATDGDAAIGTDSFPC
jgi:hypothetical protein